MGHKGQFESKSLVDHNGRECTGEDHIGERYMTWENFSNVKTGHKGKEPRCKDCKSTEQKVRHDKKRVTKTSRHRDPDTWDTKGANEFLSRRL